MSSAPCQDCGGRHETGRDGLLCDLRIGGEDRVRRNLTLQGVAPSVIERTIRDLTAEGPDHE